MTIEIDHLLVTEKQRAFSHDFFENTDEYERWEDVDSDLVAEGSRTFTVAAEDIIEYSRGILDDNPLFTDEEAATNGPYGGLVGHPLFLTPIAFWLTGDSGPGSWVRTPGAINPGQRIEFYEQIRPGDTIRVTTRFHDKWIKRGKRYLSYRLDFSNQEDTLVARWWVTLILPRSRGGETHAF